MDRQHIIKMNKYKTIRHKKNGALTQVLINADIHEEWEQVPSPEGVEEQALSDFLRERKWIRVMDDWQNPYTKVVQDKATALITEIQALKYKLEKYEGN